MIRILADENIPGESVRLLREAGYDVAAIVEIAAGMDDPSVLTLAHTENRLLLTFDRDFGELVFRHAGPALPGVVLFRFIPRSPGVVARLVRMFEEELSMPLVGYFTVVSDVHDRPVRQRPMPGARSDT